jgi:AraC-like DNA-binding protein
MDVVDQKRLLMIYENGEIMEFDLKTEKVLHRGMSYGYEDSHIYNRTTVMLRYKDGYYQIRNGEKKSILLHYDLNSREWKTIMRMDYHLNNLAEYGGILYLPCEYGYWTYDILTDETRHYETLRLKDGTTLATDINTICFDKQGGLWAGTEKCGLLYSRMLTVPFKTYSWDMAEALRYDEMIKHSEVNTLISEFGGKKATCMFIDSRNWTWVGAPTGLSCYKTPQSDPIVITRGEGLLNNVIHSIIEDDLHNIWVSTSYGITCVVIDKEKVRYVMSYNDNDNVPNETFYNGSVMKLEDGSIVMKGENHIVLFNPKQFRLLQKEQSFKLYPKLVKLMVNGNVVTAGKEVEGSIILEKAVTRTKEIDLNYDQNTLSLTFSGLNYIRPLQTFYRVRVKGLIDQWTVMSYYNSGGKVDKRGLLHLPLNLLKPGSYEVEVQTSLFPDEWTTEPYTWIINVHEPWWRTSGMIALLTLILLVLAVLNFMLYNRNTRMKMKRNNDEGDIIRRIKNFIDRCDSYEGKVIAPSRDEVYGEQNGDDAQLTDEFINAMGDIVPYVHDLQDGKFTMHNLSEETGINIVDLYQIVSGNLYKSPMLLARSLRLQHAAELLDLTDKTIEEIALECKFSSPNYFIANFYHKYKQTPNEYRAERPENPNLS